MKLATKLRRLAVDGEMVFTSDDEIAYAVKRLGKAGVTKNSPDPAFYSQALTVAREIGRLVKGFADQKPSDRPVARAAKALREAEHYKGSTVVINKRGPTIATVRSHRNRRVLDPIGKRPDRCKPENRDTSISTLVVAIWRMK